MRRGFVIGTAVLVLCSVAVVGLAQQPAPGGTAGAGGMGPGMMGQGGMMGMMGMHGAEGGAMGGMMGSGMPGGMRHLEHLIIHNPKAAARLMRFRADMLRAIGEVLQRHAAELEKAQ